MCGLRPDSSTANVLDYSYIEVTALASGSNEHENPCTGHFCAFVRIAFFVALFFCRALSHECVSHGEEYVG